MDLMLIGGAFAVVASFGVLWWAVSGDRTEAIDLGSTNVRDQRELLLARSASERTVTPWFERMGSSIARLAPSARLQQAEKRLHQAGMAETWSVERLYAFKVIAAIGLGLLLSLRLIANVTLVNVLLLIAAMIFGWFIPNIIVTNNRQKRQEAIRAEVADTVDQLTVMVRAGLGLDGAMARLVRTNDGPLALELARVQQDMRFGMSRDAALANMAERVDVSDLRAVIGAISQSERLGVPIAQTLQIQAEELRDRRRQYAEEKAMKLPVKILFPLMVCILPVLFIILLGPAFMRILDQLGS